MARAVDPPRVNLLLADDVGLDFAVIDSDRCARVRRDFGSAANPFNVHSLAIVSLPWLRGPKA